MIRRYLINLLLNLTGSNIPKNLREIRRIHSYDQDRAKEYQNRKLEQLLLYSYRNVPYYSKILEEAEIKITQIKGK